MNDHKKYLIIYHKEDNDGVFSAAIFYDYITRVLNYKLEDICFIGADYNMLTQFAKDNDVKKLHEDFDCIIMTDISFNDVSYMKKLWKEFGHGFVWCDHHAPIIKESIKNNFDDIPGIRDTGRSAILCVYKFLYDQFDEEYNSKKVPELLRILSAWDSWSYEREGYDFEFVRKVNKGVTYKYNLELGKTKELVSNLIQTYQTNKPCGSFSGQFKDNSLIKELSDTGSIIANVEDRNMENIVNNVGDTSWYVQLNDTSKHSACALFMQGGSSSTIFKSLQNTNIRHGLVFKHSKNGNWVLSMYNVNDSDEFHCGDFLKTKYNGGGHKGAAGCTLTEKQFIKILQSRTI